MLTVILKSLNVGGVYNRVNITEMQTSNFA